MAHSTKFVRPRYFSLLLMSSLAVNMLALALPLMTMQVYDRILSNKAEDTLLVLSLGVFIAAIMEFTLRCCRSVIVGLNGANFEHEAATTALERLLETEPRSARNATPAILAQDIWSAARLKDYYGGQMIVTLLIDAPFILVFLGLEAYLAGWLALVPCVMLGIFLFISWAHGRALKQLINERDQHDNARYSFITHALQVIHSIKALCMESPMARRFEEVQRESGPLNYKIACTYGQSGSLSYGFAQAMTIAVICAGVPLAISSHITIGTLIACVLLSGQVMQPLQRALAMWVRFQDIALAKERLNGLMDLPRRNFIDIDKLEPNHGELKLENVRFGFEEGKPILDGVSLKVSPGDAIAITGASGSGKTALMELIAGIYAPDKGSVLVSNMDASEIPITERSHYIAYLHMNGMILRGSIMENLTGFNQHLHAKARAVAEQLGIEEAVSLLPSGYDTPLEGHMTDVISPGLKQRISVAQGLLHKPRLILFDNADHGMDHESYSKIFELMARLKGKTTMILVSEDRNIISLADFVYDLRQGQLTPTMSPAQTGITSKFANRGGGRL